ncbi:ROK family protein [Saccharopolyspora gregorii]|uniref:ROK family protein n=1 Tax=Saccharopolyspora gregorii TaxID=33914 RepID=UPI0021AD3791|nr:ROK family protein [Saccharopolyspora gregorii]
MNPITVIDVGGTRLRAADWTPEHGLAEITETTSPSISRRPGADVAQLRAELVRDLCAAVPAGRVAGISFGAALDHRTGTVHASAPLWGSCAEPFDLLGALRSARPDVRWHVVNDVTAALLHAITGPRYADDRKVLLATISTGIACRTVDRRRGEIPVDECGLQGEIGHLPIAASWRGEPLHLPCDCGVDDHLSAFASGPGIRRVAEEVRRRDPAGWRNSALGRAEDGTAFEDAFRAALDHGDRLATALLAAVTAPVADLLRTAVCLDPELDHLVLTGGVVTGLGEHYRGAVLAHLERAGTYLTGDRVPGWAARRLVVDDASTSGGLVGAGLAAREGR